MPFHTKTIERILSPVAQQVSKLFLLFEDAGAGAEIPDFEVRVDAVKVAVDNLVTVGYQTIEASDDKLLQRDMPPSLKRVEDASGYLHDAVVLLQGDPDSTEARRKLIEGSRGILQGTSAVLLAFDMSEVRKIIAHCQNVLLVLSTTEDVRSLTSLADFVKRLTPCMARMIKEVDSRQEELTILSHAALLQRGIEQVKRLTPIMISALKLFVNTNQNCLPGAAESQANRDFLLSKMSGEIHEIIRGLQLTETDSSELFDDASAAVHMNKTTLGSQVQFATEWISNRNGAFGIPGEKALRQVLTAARNLASLTGSTSSNSPKGQMISKLCDEIEDIMDSLIELRRSGKINSPEAIRLSSACNSNLSQLAQLCNEISTPNDHRSPLFRLARTLEGKLKQAQLWLSDPSGPVRQVGLEACRSLVQGARNILRPEASHGGDYTNGFGDKEANDACLEACEHIERAAERLFVLSSQPPTTETRNAQRDLALAISRSLAYVWQTLGQALTDQVAEAYTDLVGPLRLLVEAACPASGDMPNENEYNERMNDFLSQCSQLASTAELAAATTLSDVWRADELRYLAGQLNELGAQVVLAGRAVILSADPNLRNLPGGASLEQSTADHFSLMRQHWTDTAERMRSLVDEAVDANAFITAQEAGMLRDSARTEESIQRASTTGVVEATTRIARRANRVLQVATREADNSEDTLYVDRMNDAVKALRSTITPMVNDAKGLVTNIDNPRMHDQWRSSNRSLLAAVGNVKQAVGPASVPLIYYHDHYRNSRYPNAKQSSQLNKGPPVQEMQEMVIHENPQSPICFEPTRDRALYQNSGPKLNHRFPHLYARNGNNNNNYGTEPSVTSPPPRTSTPDTEIEEEFNFPPPEENQPIMAAAHALHHEARFWSSRDNELVAATKRMAALMARLSQIVRGEYGSKRDLITVSMAIAEASLDVSRCAKVLAKECTDRRIRLNLQQLSDRILTIGNQLKILSTVKATMLGTQGSAEDQENTDSLVGNAQNLMQTVIETLHAAEGASIKMRVHSGFKIIWRPRSNVTVQARPTAR